MLLATPGIIAPAAVATKPAMRAYSIRSCPWLSVQILKRQSRLIVAFIDSCIWKLCRTSPIHPRAESLFSPSRPWAETSSVVRSPTTPCRMRVLLFTAKLINILNADLSRRPKCNLALLYENASRQFRFKGSDGINEAIAVFNLRTDGVPLPGVQGGHRLPQWTRFSLPSPLKGVVRQIHRNRCV